MRNKEETWQLGRDFNIPDNSVMLDIETTGTNPWKNNILQISAVRFNSDFDIIDEFDYCLDFPEDRVHSLSTLEWWKETDRELFSSLIKRALPYRDVLRMFASYLGEKAYIWAWPTSFDCCFVQSYAESYCDELKKRLHFWRFIDCRSWMLGARGKLVSSKEQAILNLTNPPFPVRAHNAIDDAKWQVWVLKELSRIVREREQESYLEFMKRNTKE